ncbi:hypothetical protein ACHWQZ_G012157 [Mnemiopsis leidyi]
MSESSPLRDIRRGFLNRVFIGSLKKSIKEAHVATFLSDKGYAVDDVKIIRDLNGRSKGYGFVDLERSEKGEMQAKFLLNQHKMWFNLINGGREEEAFFIVFKSAYRKSKVNPVKVVKEISTNEIYSGSFRKTILHPDETTYCTGSEASLPPNLNALKDGQDGLVTMTTATSSGTGTTGTIGSLPLAGPTCWVPLTGFQQLYQCYECTQPVFYVYSYS